MKALTRSRKEEAMAAKTTTAAKTTKKATKKKMSAGDIKARRAATATKLPYKTTKAAGLFIFCAKITYRKSDNPKDGLLRENLVFGAEGGDRSEGMKKCRAIVSTMNLIRPKIKLRSVGLAYA